MTVFGELRKPFYKRLREGKGGSKALYYLAGISFWLLQAGRLYIGTRVVEIPWVLAELKNIPESLRILQVGDVILKRALDKHEVTVVDLGAEENSQPGLRIHKTDIRNVALPTCYFDLAISLSTLEHIGLQEPEFTDGDKIAVDIIAKALKPDGLFFLTVPFGEPMNREPFRVYDLARLEFILGGKFEILQRKFLRWNKFRWQEISPEDAQKTGFLKENPSMNLGVCLVKARRMQ